MFLNFDLLIISAGPGLRHSRETTKSLGITAIRIRAGQRRNKGVELFKVSLQGKNIATLVAHMMALIFQNLEQER